MKKIIFIIMAAVCAAQAGAQTIKYRTLEECNNDPLLYIEYNYIHHAAGHVGQTVYEFAQQFELPVSPEQVWPRVYLMTEGGDGTIHGYYTGIYLDFYYDNIKYSIHLSLNPPYTNNYNDANSPLYRMSDEEVSWYAYYNTLFRNNTIKKIWVHKMKDGEYVTDTYDHFRDHYKVSENLREAWINE